MELPTTKDNTEQFLGYNHNLRNGDGEWYDETNMTCDYYPLASPRNKRSEQLPKQSVEFEVTESGETTDYKTKNNLALAYTDDRLITLQELKKITTENNEEVETDNGCVFIDNGVLVGSGASFIPLDVATFVVNRQGVGGGGMVVNHRIDTSLFPSNANVRFTTSEGYTVDGVITFRQNYTDTAIINFTPSATVVATRQTNIKVNCTNLDLVAEQYEAIVEKAEYFLNNTKHQLVRMGSYICAFPDGVVYESASTASGVPIYKVAHSAEEDHITLTTVITDNTSTTGYKAIGDLSETITSGSDNYRLVDGTSIQYYIEDSKTWVNQPTSVMIKGASGTFDGFNEGDALSMLFECTDEMGEGDLADITGFYGLISYNWQKKTFEPVSIRINKKGSITENNTTVDYIVVDGFIAYKHTGAGGGSTKSSYSTGDYDMSFERKKPDFAFACESQNRIWSCSKDGHEIYASALGNPYNYYDFSGLATDSYAVNVGTEGKFTGCVNYLGQPLFFKENALHYISGSYPTNEGTLDGMSYAVTTTTDFKGVEAGSENSFAIIDNILYYKSAAGIVAFDGAATTVISDALGKERYKNAVAGAYKNKYYVSMQDSKGDYHMFVYDTSLGVWSREDNTEALQFIKVNNELLYADVTSEKVMSVADTDVLHSGSYTVEDDFDWQCITGNFGYSLPSNKYVSRLQLRIKMTDNSRAAVYIQYDSDGVWQRKGELVGRGIRTHLLPIVPVRCDHMAIKIEGKGDVKVYSIAKILEEGGDV